MFICIVIAVVKNMNSHCAGKHTTNACCIYIKVKCKVGSASRTWSDLLQKKTFFSCLTRWFILYYLYEHQILDLFTYLNKFIFYYLYWYYYFLNYYYTILICPALSRSIRTTFMPMDASFTLLRRCCLKWVQNTLIKWN